MRIVLLSSLRRRHEAHSAALPMVEGGMRRIVLLSLWWEEGMLRIVLPSPMVGGSLCA